jgi:hypothetical protein
MNIVEGAVPFVILSADHADSSPVQNCVDNAALNKSLEDSPHDYGRVTGRYKGKDERSFIVLCPLGRRDAAYKLAHTLAARHQQESVLYVNERCEAFLEFCSTDAPRVAIGTWRAATPAEAASAEALTIDSKGTVWIAA